MSNARKRHCAFLTMQDTAGWSIDADLAIEPLQDLGWLVESVPWRKPGTDWSRYEAVYIGTPWDYPEDPQHFLAVLRKIERDGCLLVNPLSLVRWNLQKTYLRDLEKRGVRIVPTVWLNSLGQAELDNLLQRWQSIVVKPVVSTNAMDTYPLSASSADDEQSLVLEVFRDKSCMAQPFISSIRTEGEFSLFFIGGEFSHAIQKRPREGDFRVQEEHGASIRAVAAEDALRSTGKRVLAMVDPTPLYARADFVRSASDEYLLMELELIEPSMYLRMAEHAPACFARAFDEHVRKAFGPGAHA